MRITSTRWFSTSDKVPVRGRKVLFVVRWDVDTVYSGQYRDWRDDRREWSDEDVPHHFYCRDTGEALIADVVWWAYLPDSPGERYEDEESL